MKEIYRTPNEEWAIMEHSDSGWKSVFGQGAVYYCAFKRSNNYLGYSGTTIEEVLRWFVKTNVISKDEMNYQIEKLESEN